MAHKHIPYGQSVWETMLACFWWNSCRQSNLKENSLFVYIWVHTWIHACHCAMHGETIVRCSMRICVLSDFHWRQPQFLILAQEMSLLSTLLYRYVTCNSIHKSIVIVTNHNILYVFSGCTLCRYTSKIIRRIQVWGEFKVERLMQES